MSSNPLHGSQRRGLDSQSGLDGLKNRPMRRLLDALLLTALVWPPAAGAAAERKPGERARGTRYALLVGVDDYAELEHLRYCGADMAALRDQLIVAGFPSRQVYLIHDKAAETKFRPSKVNIEKQLGLVLNQVEADDVLVFAFSGHGVHREGKSYLLPNEANLDDPQTLIPLDSVYERLGRCKASLKVLLVDACRDDPRPRGRRSATAKQDTAALAQQLERVPQGTLLLTSCAPQEVSMEEPKFGHGVFMNFLLEGLRGKADEDGDGAVTLKELHKYASRNTRNYVANKWNSYQSPRLTTRDAEAEAVDFAVVKLSIVNSIGMKLQLIPAGEFVMGTSREEIERLVKEFPKNQRKLYENEYPPHRVRITRPFYLGTYEVTVGQFRRFVNDTGYKTEAEKDGKGGGGWKASGEPFVQAPQYNWRNTGFVQTDEHPVVNVSWHDAVAFCEWLRQKEGAAYRLPTEAEWEYSCRAGTTTWYYCGNDPEQLAMVGNVADGTSRERFINPFGMISARDGYVFTAPVGRFQPNAFGLYDMHGNVAEWCADALRAYTDSPVDDPQGSATASIRVTRGGSGVNGVGACRSAYRYGSTPSSRHDNLGFRVARVPSGR